MAKTIDVAVAVAVNSAGGWIAEGWDGASRRVLRQSALECVDEGNTPVYWLKATLAVPEPIKDDVEVAAKVEPD